MDQFLEGKKTKEKKKEAFNALLFFSSVLKLLLAHCGACCNKGTSGQAIRQELM